MSIRKLSVQYDRQPHRSHLITFIKLVQPTTIFDQSSQTFYYCLWQRNQPALLTFTSVNMNLVLIKVDILHPQPRRLANSDTATV